jgi:hypothetical protein
MYEVDWKQGFLFFLLLYKILMKQGDMKYIGKVIKN